MWGSVTKYTPSGVGILVLCGAVLPEYTSSGVGILVLCGVVLP